MVALALLHNHLGALMCLREHPTKATLIYHRTENLRIAQLLLGHGRLERTVRYLGIEVNDALAMAAQTEV